MASYFGNVPEESKHYETKKLRFLARICYQLQQLSDSEPFSLSWNDVALVLKVSASCAGDYLKMLKADGVLRVVEKNTDTLATKYRYTGPSQAQDT